MDTCRLIPWRLSILRRGVLATVAVVAIAGCERPPLAEPYERPSEVRDFDRLFADNCSGCHGADGKLGPAPPLADPLFLAVIPDAEFKLVVSEGRAGTLMPAFARERGGTLTEEQIAILIGGIRAQWSSPELRDAQSLPDYLPPADKHDAHAVADRLEGSRVFALVCGNCHGERGEGGKQAGALHDTAFLSLVSDQALRRIVITGRPDLGMPDFRRLGAMMPAGQPLTNQQITDVVALLASWRFSHEKQNP